jgi:hypothetical protein
VTFSAAGTVETATLRPPFAGTDVGACVARNFGSAHVPAFNGGRISVGKTFVVPAP